MRSTTTVPTASSRRTGFVSACLLILLSAAVSGARAQSAAATANKERANANSTINACTLITRADVKSATGQDPLVDAESDGANAWICNVGTAELKVYTGAKSLERWEATLKNFKQDKAPRTPAPGYGNGAYFLYSNMAPKAVGNVGFLVATSGDRTLVLSLDAPTGKTAESTRPALESLMKVVMSRLEKR